MIKVEMKSFCKNTFQQLYNWSKSTSELGWSPEGNLILQRRLQCLYIWTCLKMFDGKSSLEKPQKCKSWEPPPYHPHREPSGRLTHGSCVWSPWNRSFHGALLSQCAFIVSSYTPQTPAKCEPEKSSSTSPPHPHQTFCLVLQKKLSVKRQQFSTSLFSWFFWFLLLGSQWFSCLPPLRPQSKHSPAMGFSH